MRAMTNNKAVGPDNIPSEVWKCLSDAGIDIVWDFMRKIACQEKCLLSGEKAPVYPCTKRRVIYSNAPSTGASNCYHIL